MPKILEIEGYKFYIYLNDHLPVHVHVWKGGGECKVLLEPEIIIQDNYDFKSQELKSILRIIAEHYTFIIEKWHEIHGK